MSKKSIYIVRTIGWSLLIFQTIATQLFYKELSLITTSLGGLIYIFVSAYLALYKIEDTRKKKKY